MFHACACRFQQFVETQLDGGGSTLKTEIETAIKTAVGNQLKRGKDGRSMSHYVSDSIEVNSWYMAQWNAQIWRD